jgi:N-acetylneuraminic acid mutarotase
MVPAMRRIVLIAWLCACGGGGGGGGDDDGGDDDGVAPDAEVLGEGWRSTAAVLGGPIQETAAVAVGDTVYVIGGFNAALGVSNQVLAYDTVGDSWSNAPDLPAAVHHANAAVVDGRIYVVGWLDGFNFTARGDVWSWAPGDAAWSDQHAAMPGGSERGASVAGAIDGAIYVAGGLRGGAAVADVSRYVVADDAWEPLDALPAARDHACGGMIAGRLIVAGGRQADIGSTSPATYAFDPAAGWSSRADMITGRGGTACGVIDGRLIVVGGEGNPDAESGVYPQVEAYDDAGDAWSSLGVMPTPRHGMGAAVVGGTLHVPGGADVQAFGAVDTNEAFTPP